MTICILAGVISVAVVAMVALLCVHNSLGFLNEVRWLPSVIIGLTVFVDVLIATSMCYWLRRARASDFQKYAIMSLTVGQTF
jgi:chromate transport protein ChrA